VSPAPRTDSRTLLTSQSKAVERQSWGGCLQSPMARVEIYTWRACPFCIRAKQLLDRKGVTYEEYAIDGDAAARRAMVERGSDGRSSVPQIFIDDQHVGGCDDLFALERQGRLDPLLAGAGAAG